MQDDCLPWRKYPEIIWRKIGLRACALIHQVPHWQNMYQNRKMPDKSSRLSAAFVRHLMQFKRKTFFRLFFIAIPLWQSFLQQLFQLCPRSLDQCCKQLMRLRNKAQPIPTCCWSETLQKESTRTMLNLLTKSQQISSFLKPPNNYIVILSRFWIN